MVGGLDQSAETTAYQAVLRAELQHLERGVMGQRNFLQWGFIWILVLIALILFVWRVINTIPQQPSLLNWLLTGLNFDTTDYYISGGLNDMLFPITLLFPLCVVLWDFWLTFKTLIMSTNSIARERNGKNWELLLLTGVNPQQVIRAKWWAVVRKQWRDYILLAIMRIGVISFLAMSFSVNFSLGRPPYFSYGGLGPETEPQRTIVFLIAISIVLLSAAFIAVLTMLNLMLTAACGIAGGVITQRPSLALPYGIGVRLLLLIILGSLVGIPGYLVLKPDIENFGYYPDPVLSTISLILFLIGITMIDNGSLSAVMLMRFGYNFRWIPELYSVPFFSSTLRGHGPAFCTALLLSIVVCAVLTRLLLMRAEKSFVSTTAAL